MPRSLPTIIIALLFSLTISGCTKRADEGDKDKAAAPVRLVVVTVVRGNVSHILDLTGSVNALPNHSVTVTSAVTGKLAKVFVVPGEYVKKGQLIAQLDSRQLADQVAQTKAQVDSAESAEDQAEIALKLAQDTEQRLQKLYERDIAAQKDLIAAKSQVASSQEALTASHDKFIETKAALAANQAQLGFAAITAPITGLVATRTANDADNVAQGAPIVQLVDLSAVDVTAQYPPSSPESIKLGQSAIVTTPAEPKIKFMGKVSLISPQVDQQSSFIQLHILCANPDGILKQGQPVSVSIVQQTASNVVVVPETALVPNPDSTNGKMIYVYNPPDKTISRRQVTTGIRQGALVEITQGVVPGEQIVADGAYGIPDKTKIEAEFAKVYPNPAVAITSD